jgi:hypothetical protein
MTITALEEHNGERDNPVPTRVDAKEAAAAIWWPTAGAAATGEAAEDGKVRFLSQAWTSPFPKSSGKRVKVTTLNYLDRVTS